MKVWAFQLLFLALLVHGLAQSMDSLKSILGSQDLGQWRTGIYEGGAEAPVPGSSDGVVLAGSRTNRPDILHGFRRYHGGWNITNLHYWTSVGFTGAAGFIVAVLWFFSFGVILVVHHCCGRRLNIKDKEGSRCPQRICLILLIVFTCVAAIGCILLSIGQVQFHDEAMNTLKYVVNQSDYTVQTLRNVTQYLTLAKTINVAQVFLPSNVKDDIDKLNVDLDAAAGTLTRETTKSSHKIKKVFNAVRSALITVASVMLVLSLLGLVLSILGYGHAIHLFIIGGWVLVAITCILCGVFVILNNAISDACMAMEEWADNPHAETSLSSILPCVDPRTTNHTLVQSKQVITNIVNIVNKVIYTVANSDPPHSNSMYYNQSGPLMPSLCYPFNSQLQAQQCGDLDVTIANASEAWQSYTCTVSALGICTSAGRVTPSMYNQLVAAVNVSYALEHYAPPLLSLQDCNFVQHTFREITSSYCPSLEDHLRVVNSGLGLISAGVLLCLVLWMLYSSRPREEGDTCLNPFSSMGGNHSQDSMY